MADTSDIAAALIAKLGSDVALLALCPNGVYWDQAPPGATRFVIVSFVAAVDVGVFRKRGYEDGLYFIEARMLSTVAGANIKAAAARIDALLEDQPLTVAGYSWMTTHREEPTRMTEVDSADPSIQWFRRGGRYRVQMSLVGA
jgi:hypothetical protein